MTDTDLIGGLVLLGIGVVGVGVASWLVLRREWRQARREAKHNRRMRVMRERGL